MRKDSSAHIVVRVFTSRFFLLGALLIAIILAVSFARAFYKDYEIRQQIKTLQSQIDELDAKRLESLDLLDYVKSDAYVEDVGRTQLGLKNPGERVIIVDTSDMVSSTVSSQSDSSASHWKQWWNYFFGEKE